MLHVVQIEWKSNKIEMVRDGSIFIFEIKLGGRRLFSTKKGGRRLFSEKNKGSEDFFFRLKKGM